VIEHTPPQSGAPFAEQLGPLALDFALGSAAARIMAAVGASATGVCSGCRGPEFGAAQLVTITRIAANTTLIMIEPPPIMA
jgi:hypothetical protein